MSVPDAACAVAASASPVLMRQTSAWVIVDATVSEPEKVGGNASPVKASPNGETRMAADCGCSTSSASADITADGAAAAAVTDAAAADARALGVRSTDTLSCRPLAVVMRLRELPALAAALAAAPLRLRVLPPALWLRLRPLPPALTAMAAAAVGLVNALPRPVPDADADATALPPLETWPSPLSDLTMKRGGGGGARGERPEASGESGE